MRSGDLKVEDYARSLLSRIEARDSVTKAWAYLDPSFVLEQARKLDAIPAEKRGPLHGIAIGVKDMILTKGKFINIFQSFFQVFTKQERAIISSSLYEHQTCQHNTTLSSMQATLPAPSMQLQ